MRKLIITVVCFFVLACQAKSDVKVKDITFFPRSAFQHRMPELSLLDRIKRDGKLVAVTRNSATTYYQDNNERPAGMEYELAKQFADHLGVQLEMLTAPDFNAMLPLLAHGKAHFAAAGLVVTPKRAGIVRFGPAYQLVKESVVYRLGQRRPRNLSELQNGTLEVVAQSRHEDRLRELQAQHPALIWAASYNNSSEDLLSMVWNKVIDYTVIDSNELAINQRYFPDLRVAFTLSGPAPLAWAFPPGVDHSLYQEAHVYFDKIKQNGTLAELQERYYGHTENFDYVGAVKFIEHMESRLPRFQGWFVGAANRHAVDWRLLAAIGYQESHWDPAAVSPTGVRGLMMLTQQTARSLNIKNRKDPRQSIYGGAKYFQKLYRVIPKSIHNPDRTWMALAAYNVGYGHLMDARRITRRRGGNPDKWIDVRENLPLLSQEKWHEHTRYGYARGHEPVVYVENIRRYYDTLSFKADRKEEPRDRGLTLAQAAR